jgi:hypothetical protein
MRTTLTLADEAFEAARTYASARSLKLGQAVSELILRASRSDRLPLKRKAGVWVFDLPPNTPKVTARQVKDWLDEGP